MDKEPDIAALLQTEQAGSFSFYLTEEVVLRAVSSNEFSWCHVFKKNSNLKVVCVIAAPNDNSGTKWSWDDFYISWKK